MTLLDSLKKQTIIVADSGDIDVIATYKPQDSTTNPSLLLKAASQPRYRGLVDDAVKYAGTGRVASQVGLHGCEVGA
jgi:transaldolase